MIPCSSSVYFCYLRFSRYCSIVRKMWKPGEKPGENTTVLCATINEIHVTTIGTESDMRIVIETTADIMIGDATETVKEKSTDETTDIGLVADLQLVILGK